MQDNELHTHSILFDSWKGDIIKESGLCRDVSRLDLIQHIKYLIIMSIQINISNMLYVKTFKCFID